MPTHHFLGESPEFVLNQLTYTVLARDKAFVQWRAAHQDSFVTGARAHAHRKESNCCVAHQITPASGETTTVAAPP